MNTRIWIVAVVSLLMAVFAPVAAMGQVTYPPRIGDRDFVADEAKLISPEDKAKIRATSEQLLDAKGIPIIVVTINSMGDYGAGGWAIERYAMNLFDEWGIGHAGGRNGGILLLVSKNDRKVRIELGSSWSHDRDAAAASIINTVMVPRFKSGQYSEGIRMGVDELAAQLGGSKQASGMSGGVARSSSQGFVPTGPVSSTPLHSTGVSSVFGGLACLVVPIIFIVIISIIARVGRGIGGMMGGGGYGGGYGPMGWGGGWGGGGGGGFLNGAILGGLLGNAWGSRRSGGYGGFGSGGNSGGSSGGGFGGGGFGGGGGGSFGGGFSGGGGATGSW